MRVHRGSPKMSHPPTENHAGRQAVSILEKALAGKRANVTRRAKAAKNIAATIWRRWQVGPWEWQLKHLNWYLVHEVARLSPSAQYDKWRAIRVLLSGTRREHLILWLENQKNNSFINVRGDCKPRGIGGRRPYLPKRSVLTNP